MGFLLLLILSLGAVIVTSASQCVPETVQCREFWTNIEPHRNLWETEKDLNSWCRTQDHFYKCLEEILLEDKNGNLSALPVNLLISKLFAKDLCTDGSHSRRRLLDNSACMNNLNTDYCTLPEYLDIVTPDDAIPASRCSFAEKTFSCIAATLVLNCGFDAGRVYRNMLKITRYSDEVCGIEVSKGIPPCNEDSLRMRRPDQMSRIFYGLAPRIGSVPEQDYELQSSSKEEMQQEFDQSDINEVVNEAIQEYLDRMGSMLEQENELKGSEEAQKRESESTANQAVLNIIQEYLDRIGNAPELENEIKDFSNEMQSSPQVQRESEQTDINEAVNEVIQEYLDRIGNVPELENETYLSEEEERESEHAYSNQAVTKVIEEYLDGIGSVSEIEDEMQDSSKIAHVRNESETIDENEAVTEVLQNTWDSLDNSMAGENELDYTMADDSEHSEISAENELKKNPIITDVYRGLLFYNYSDIEYALYWRQPDFTAAENISCEQVQPFKGYVLGCVGLYRHSDPDCLSKATVHEKVTPELIRDLDPEVPDDSIAEFGPRPYWMKDFDDAHEAKRLRDLAKATAEPLQTTESPAISTTASTLLHIVSKVPNTKTKNWWDMDWMGKYTNSMLPNDVHLELMELFFPEPEKYDPPPSLSWNFGDAYYVFMYDPRVTNTVEKVVCSRLDECHPRGRGLWKCKVVRRTKPCYGCHESLETTEGSDSVQETADPKTVNEGSGLLDSSESYSSIEMEHEKGSEHDQSAIYLNDVNYEDLSEEDDLSETELKEAIADEINYKLKTETDQQLKNDFHILLLDSVLHPSRYEHLSGDDESDDVEIEDEDDSEWATVPETEDDLD